MTYKLFKSRLTWRSMDYQDAAFIAAGIDMKECQVFIELDQRDEIVRATSRETEDTLCVVSLAILAERENDFRLFLKACRKKGTEIRSLEDKYHFSMTRHQTIEDAVRVWKKARMGGAGKVGGLISAERKEAATRQAIELIREDWPKPSSEFSTQELKDRCDLSLNTIKKHLGSRPIAQYNYQAAQKRKERRNAKN